MTTLAAEDWSQSVASKIRRRVLPLLFVAWFIAYINRFNVSFAALQMNTALGLSPAVFGFGAGVFFLGYGLFEIPSNIVLARVGPRRWLARIMLCVGVMGTAMALTSGPTSFYTLRFLLGIAEAGSFPGMVFYLSQWLPPRERAAAFGALGSAAMVSGIAGGPLAALFMSLDGAAGLAGWRWLFLLEGLPAIAIALCLWRYLPDGPASASWLTPEERRWVVSHQDSDQQVTPTLATIWAVTRDVRYMLWSLAFFCASATGASVRLFRPTILRDMAGVSDAWASVLTAAPGIVGAIAIVYVGRRSTRMDERRWHAAVPMMLTAMSVMLMGVTHGVAGALVVSSLASLGAAAQPPLFGSVSSASRGAVNVVGIAFVNSFGALGSFVGPYAVGFSISLGGVAAGCAIASFAIALGACVVLMPRDPARARAAIGGPATV